MRTLTSRKCLLRLKIRLKTVYDLTYFNCLQNNALFILTDYI